MKPQKVQILCVNMPASLFGAVLGIAGLAGAWRAAVPLWGVAAWPGEAIAALAVLVWLASLVLYLGKWACLPALAWEELRHPVQSGFVMMIPVSTMLVAMLLLPYGQAPARTLYVAGMGAAVLFSVWQQGSLMQGGRDPGTTTAALYVPSVAASFVGALGAGAFGWQNFAQLLFGAGVLSWLALESVLLNRMLHGQAMQPALRASFGIQLAAPSVGLLALFASSGAPPALFALMFFGYALIQLLLGIRLLPWLLEGGFGPGFWSFAFGIGALSSGAIKLAARGLEVAEVLAPWLFLLTIGVVGIVGLRSIRLLVQLMLKLLPQSRGRVSAKWGDTVR